ASRSRAAGAPLCAGALPSGGRRRSWTCLACRLWRRWRARRREARSVPSSPPWDGSRRATSCARRDTGPFPGSGARRYDRRMESTSRDDILEGLNVFRALESWGAQLYAAWAEHESDPHLRAGHPIIAEREANHARLLAERLRALGAQPGPACVDQVLAEQLAELRDVRGFVAQLDALKAANERDRERMAGCRAALDRGFAAAEASDAETHRFWAQLYSAERGSGGC